MKKLKFVNDLVQLILDGSKTATWRLFDDKDLRVGDKLEFLNRETGQIFARAEIAFVKEKQLGDVAEADFDGHETYKDKAEMLTTYRGYYGDKVNWGTVVKMIDFKLIPKL